MENKSEILTNMKTVLELKNEIRMLNEDIDTYFHHLASLCPIQKGELVEITGYAHKGKRMQVRDISFGLFEDKYGWMLSGPALSKHGESVMPTKQFLECEFEN